MILELITVDGSRFEKTVKREPAGAEFIKRVWMEPYFEECTLVGTTQQFTVLSRHVVAFRVARR